MKHILLDPAPATDTSGGGATPAPATSSTPAPSNAPAVVDFAPPSRPTMQLSVPSSPMPEANTPASTPPTDFSKTGKTLSLSEFDGVPVDTNVPNTTKPAEDKTKLQQVIADNKEQTPQDNNQVVPRDYSFAKDDTEKQLLSKVGNKTYEYLKVELPRLRSIEGELKTTRTQLQELQQNKLPANYHQHPSAYLLSPDYQKASQELQYLNFEEKHWTDQMIRLRSGEKEIYDLQYDQGKPVYRSVPVTPDQVAKLETELGRSIQATMLAKQQTQRVASDVQQQYGNRYKIACDNTAQLEKQYLAAYADKATSKRAPEMKAFAESFIQPEFREHPLASVLASAYGLILDLNAQIAEFKAKEVKTTTVAADAKLAGPTAGDTSGGGSGGAGTMLRMSDFEKE